MCLTFPLCAFRVTYLWTTWNLPEDIQHGLEGESGDVRTPNREAVLQPRKTGEQAKELEQRIALQKRKHWRTLEGPAMRAWGGAQRSCFPVNSWVEVAWTRPAGRRPPPLPAAIPTRSEGFA